MQPRHLCRRSCSWTTWPGLARTLAVLACVTLLPAIAHAQASLRGRRPRLVRRGAAWRHCGSSQQVLIEKVRTSVTDGTGQYRIPELPARHLHRDVRVARLQHRPAARSGCGRRGSDHDQRRMRVGSLQETITVTGETPIVDVQSARRGQVLSDEVWKRCRRRAAMELLIVFPVPSGPMEQTDDRCRRCDLLQPGRPRQRRTRTGRRLNVGSAFNGGGVAGYGMDTPNAQEVQL